MADLKIDLKNKLMNDKYFAEIELVRLAQEPAMNYKEKIDSMKKQLDEIVVLNGGMELIEVYFQQPEGQQGVPQGQQPMPQLDPNAAPQPVQQQPAGKVHPGQTHGE